MTAEASEDVLGAVRDQLADDGAALSASGVARALRAGGRPVGDATVLAVHERLQRDIEGAGLLQPLLQLPGVTDVLVNGADQVWIDRGEGLERTGVRFGDDEEVRRLAQRLAAGVGRRLDDATPHVDLRLRDGTRFHAVLAPLSRPGTLISLRIPARVGLDLGDLEQAGSINADGRDLLRRLIDARAAFLISGGTGTGKTTLLGALLGLVPATDRIVVVEDSAELRPDHPHVVALEARPANVEGAGEIRLRTLVRQALRMRPDRLVVGEVRGEEVVDLLAAMNTGHEGGCGTIHANSAIDVPARVESLGTAAGLSREAVHAQFLSAVDVVIHLHRPRGRPRLVREIGVVHREPEGARVTAAVRFARSEADVAPRTIEDDGLERLAGILDR